MLHVRKFVAIYVHLFTLPRFNVVYNMKSHFKQTFILWISEKKTKRGGGTGKEPKNWNSKIFQIKLNDEEKHNKKKLNDFDLLFIIDQNIVAITIWMNHRFSAIWFYFLKDFFLKSLQKCCTFLDAFILAKIRQ